jgi:hypothetical protein
MLVQDGLLYLIVTRHKLTVHGNTAKKCVKSSTCQRKFRRDQVQRHICMRKGFLIPYEEMCEYLSFIWKPFVITPDPFQISQIF